MSLQTSGFFGELFELTYYIFPSTVQRPPSLLSDRKHMIIGLRNMYGFRVDFESSACMYGAGRGRVSQNITCAACNQLLSEYENHKNDA